MKILFVCMGNICRSPAAEAIFRAKAEEKGFADRITCDSAGTIAYHTGERADRRMREAAERRGYLLESRARQVKDKDFSDFDRIIAMDLENLAALEHLASHSTSTSNHSAKISLMSDFSRTHQEKEVPDPYYGGDRGFEKVLDMLEDACEGLLEELDR